MPAPAAGVAARYDARGHDGSPIRYDTEFNHRLEASIMAVVGDRAESDGSTPSFSNSPGWREIFGHPGLLPLPAPDPRAVQPGLYVGNFAQQHRDHRRMSLCSRLASTRNSSPPTPSARTRDGRSRESEEQPQIRASLERRPHPASFHQSPSATVRTNRADRPGTGIASG